MAKYIDDSGFTYIWSKLKSLLSGKVDTEDGKGLSTNDYTDEEKEKLANLDNYDDAEITANVETNTANIAELQQMLYELASFITTEDGEYLVTEDGEIIYNNL